jgi:ribosomal protein S19E (S16A)
VPNRANPAKLNALQLKTLAILQEAARSGGGEAQPDGSVALSRLPRPHGDHFHVGSAVVMARDATGLANPAVYNALRRKGLISQAPDGRLLLSPHSLSYETGVAETILHRADH